MVTVTSRCNIQAARGPDSPKFKAQLARNPAWLWDLGEGNTAKASNEALTRLQRANADGHNMQDKSSVQLLRPCQTFRPVYYAARSEAYLGSSILHGVSGMWQLVFEPQGRNGGSPRLFYHAIMIGDTSCK